MKANFTRCAGFNAARMAADNGLVSVGWVFLPAIGAPLVHGPVLRADLAPSLKRPISTELFGQNKTWRGALVMTGGPVAASLALGRVPAYRRRLPDQIADAHPALVGAVLGVSSWIGELPNSFVKRRIGIRPGERRRSMMGLAISIFDQADWVPVAALLLRPIWRMSASEIAQAFGLVVAVHVPINVVGYAIGARTSPI
jgi:CDP-archaeol synthase